MAVPEGKMLDIETMEFVDVPKEAPAEVKKEDKKEDDDAPDDDAKDEVKDSAAEVETEEEKETEEKEEEKSDEKTEEEKKAEEEDVQGIDDYLKETFGEKFGINSEDDLQATLAALDDVNEENTTLKSQIEELKKGKSEPKFSSDQEKKAFEFIKQFPVDKMGDGMQTFARLVTLDLEKSEPKILLEEKFILENSFLTREEALRKFNRDYNKKYVVNRDDFDDEDKYKEELEDRKIDAKVEADKAKKFLAKQQEEFKSKEKISEGDQSAKVTVEVEKSVKANVSELNDFMKEFETIIYAPDDNQENDFNYKLTRDQKSQVHEAMKAWVGNPASYKTNGEIAGGYDVNEKVIAVAAMLFHEDMIEKAIKTGQSKGQIKRADEIATKKPNRVSKTSDGKAAALTEEQQQEVLIKQKKLERSKMPRRGD